MHARVKYLAVSSALVGATLGGMSFATAAPGVGQLAMSGTRMTSAANSVHSDGSCKKDQIDACKPGGCCIVN